MLEEAPLLAGTNTTIDDLKRKIWGRSDEHPELKIDVSHQQIYVRRGAELERALRDGSRTLEDEGLGEGSRLWICWHF